ncbi:MAG: glycosyltransferase family 2 protein [Lachnospiraceae bacterium]|nr:glycosyltransferase family 2 protein [Lachnospiraceae bacterium]
METTVSVIVPIYNVEHLLERCVDSILEQTKKDLEIILVDDGSTDGSGRLCDLYAQRDRRIQVLHKENGGLTSAWKAGLGLATSCYVGFVDSDDWIDPDMYERMYEMALAENADMVVCGLVYEFQDPKIPKRQEGSNFRRKIYEREDLEKIFPRLINDGHFFGRTIQPARVTKLYRRLLLKQNLQFCSDKVSVGEDMQITFPVLLDVGKLCVLLDFYPYHYWITESSMTGKHDSAYLEKVKRITRQLYRISDAKKVYDFKPQIRNDFLSLSVLAVKNEIYRNYRAGRRVVVENVRQICEDSMVREALAGHTMDQLSFSIRLYLYLMRRRHYRLCYWMVLVFFKMQYYLGREYKRQ